MQYSFILPGDYDMRHIRERVAAASHLLDEREGLGLKAYTIRERGVDGSPVNQYACLYLWNDPDAMASFLLSGTGGFERIIRTFGRTMVRHWLGVACFAGAGRGDAPVTASWRATVPAEDPDADDSGRGLSRRVDAEVELLRALAADDGVHTAALLVDPRSWELVRFVLRSSGSDPDASERAEVVHVSAPEIGDLPEGRVW